MDHFFIIGPGMFGEEPGSGAGGFYNPPFTDPAKFPRAEPIFDDELILRLEEIEKHNERLRELVDQVVSLREQANIVKADMEAQRARVFPALRKNHPEVIKGYGYGFRQHEGKFYAVGWNSPHEDQHQRGAE